MDRETWNGMVHQMHIADQRSTRLMALADALEPLATEATALGLEPIAARLHAVRGEVFTLGCQAQSYAADLYGELDAARAAGEEPPD
jgi:hypothetical protein